MVAIETANKLFKVTLNRVYIVAFDIMEGTKLDSIFNFFRVIDKLLGKKVEYKIFFGL